MFSTESLVLQLGYALLVVALLARTTHRMRMLISGAGLLLLVRGVMMADYAAIGWMLVLISAWLIMLWSDRHESGKVRFTEAEERMRRTILDGLRRTAARQFIDQGLWLHGRPGDELTREGEPVANLYYLASGGAVATSQAREVGSCHPGDLIVEATVLSGDAATATITLSVPSHFWCAATPALRRFLDDHEGLRSAIERSFSNAVNDKLRAANRAIAMADRAA